MRSWKCKYDLLPPRRLGKGHYVSLRVECEHFGFKAPEGELPLFPWDTSRIGPQGEEPDRCAPGDPIRATHSDGIVRDRER